MAYTQEQLKEIQARVAQQTGQTVPLSDLQTLVSNPQALNHSNAVFIQGSNTWENRLPTSITPTWTDQWRINVTGSPQWDPRLNQSYGSEAEVNAAIAAGPFYASGDAGGALQASPVNDGGWNLGEESFNLISQMGANNLRPEFHRKADGSLGEFAGYTIKSGDKQGTMVPYVKNEDGSYSPDYSGQQDMKWNTTNRKYGLMVVGAIAAAAAAAGAGLLGTTAQSAVGAGTTAAEGAAAAGSGGLFESAYGAASALDGSAGAISGFAPGGVSGTTAFGTPFATGATLSGAGEAAGSLFGLPNMVGVPGAVAGGAASVGTTAAELAAMGLGPNGLPNTPFEANYPGTSNIPGASNSLPDWLKPIADSIPGITDAAGSIDWSKLIGLIGSGVNAGRNEEYIDKLLALGTEKQGEYLKAGQDYSQGLLGLNEKYGDMYKPQYAQVNNGFAASNIDPVTGQVSYSLNAPYASARDEYLSAADQVMGQAKDFNPQTFAADRFGEWQGLLAPERSKQQNDLMQNLYATGTRGLSVNTDTQNGIVGLNPLANSMYAAWAQSDKEAGYQSLREGETYLDNLLNRQKGLFSSATGIESLGGRVLDDAASWSNTFTDNNRTAANFLYGNEAAALKNNMTTQQDYIKALLNLNANAMGADYLRQNQMISGATSNLPGMTNVIGALPWSDIFNGLFGK